MPAIVVAAFSVFLLALATARLIDADVSMQGPPEATVEYADAAAAEAALSRHPTDPFAWLMLSQARWMSGDAERSLAAYRRSIASAPVAPALALRRVEIGLRLWLVLQPDDRDRLRDQIALAWINAPIELSLLGGREPWAAAFIRDALPDNEAMRKDFDRWGKAS